MIKEGRKAPAFNLASSEGGKVALKDLAGKFVILYFYPKDMTPGCTIEAQEFRDLGDALAKRDALVFGVSKDSIERHEKFRDKESLNFPLLSDPEGVMIEKYDAWGEKKNYGKTYMGIIRSTLIIGPEGKVRKHFPKVARTRGHAAKVLDALEELQS